MQTTMSLPNSIVPWSDEARLSCELVVISSYKPLHLRQSIFCAIIYWSQNNMESNLRVVDYGSDPSAPQIVYCGQASGSLEEPNIRFAAMETLEIRGIAFRIGRRYLSCLERGPGGLEFRVRAYQTASPTAIFSRFVVPMPQSWSQAEVFDTCTIFGRIMIREYDDSSDSEHPEGQPFPGLALLDFTSRPGQLFTVLYLYLLLTESTLISHSKLVTFVFRYRNFSH